MEITEVRVKLMEDSDDRLQAFCSITFDDCFVVRDLKIIEGSNGPFVAMPSRKLTGHCPDCGCKNHLRSSFCNYCGEELADEPPPRDATGRTKLYADIAHPINSECREMVQARVIEEFENEVQRAQQPGYRSRYDDDFDDDWDGDDFPAETSTREQKGEDANRRVDAAEPLKKSKSRQASPEKHSATPTSESGGKESGPSESGASESGSTSESPELEECSPPTDGKHPGEKEVESPASQPTTRPHTQLQPAEADVPAPHTRTREEGKRSKGDRAAETKSESKGRPDDDFGAGIF